MNVSILGLNIKEIRTRQKISGSELAKRAGVGSATISQIENGTRQTLKGTTINKIADALHVSVNELLRDGDSVQIDTDDACDILSVLCSSGCAKLDGQLLDEGECILLENAIMLAINGLRMRRIELQHKLINRISSKKALKVIK